jgi:PKD repeat protein
VNLNLGLKAHYSFSGNANDVSGNGLHGVIQGNPKLTTDRFGNANSAYQFDGIKDGIIITDKGKLSTPAFSIVYYFSTESTDLQVAVGKINYENGNAATFNSGVSNEGKTTFFGTMAPLDNCNLGVPTTYVYTLTSYEAVKLNQWHCVVHTFENGVETLYLDGFLMKQGTLPFNNAAYCDNTNLTIGTWWKEDQRRFKGKIDEVRYYDRAINANEITALCMRVQKQTISNIINEYTPITDLNICNNTVTVENPSAFNPGDTILIIQMKGAVIDSSNNAAFGTVTNYRNAGNYEFNIVKQKTGNTITLLNTIERQYNVPDGKVQLIRVPYYENAEITSTLTCLPWDGLKGGVLAFNVRNNINMQADIDVSESGFKAGSPMRNRAATFNQQGYFYNRNPNNGGEKGEGIYSISDARNYGRGASANGGGGGNAHNTGGGGGGNGGAGGDGGDQWITQKEITEQVGGKGGKALTNNTTINKLFLGGGAGMGQANDLYEYPAGNGGGIIIINAGSLTGNNFSIKANGGNGIEAPYAAVADDGVGGGGAGGSILLNIPTITGNTLLLAKGGNGANHIANNVLQGPGGGGGGGVIALSQPMISPQLTLDFSGGKNGVNINLANNAWGATPGKPGNQFNNFNLFTAQVPFKKNIDSIRINGTVSECIKANFTGLAYTNTNPINTWSWFFGDGKTSNIQNPEHSYAATGNYQVKLVATDQNGCKDSIIKPIPVQNLEITKSRDTAVCENTSVNLFAGGGTSYSWFPATNLSNPNSSNPVATPLVPTKYYVTVSDNLGCTKMDSISITLNSLPEITTSNDTTICYKTPAPLFAGGGISYAWSPGINLTNPTIANPVASPAVTTTYTVKVTNAAGCSKEESIQVNVNPLPSIQKSKDTLVCKNVPVQLFISGGNSYVWSPETNINNTTSSTPMVSPLATTMYYVSIVDALSCVYKDSVKVSVREPANFSISPNSSVCVNTPKELTAAGGTSYTWEPAMNLNNPNIANPKAIVDNNTTFTVLIKEEICNETATLTTTLSALQLPVVKASKSNDINCSFPSSNLIATGAQSYSWSPVNGLNSSFISNPTATPSGTTTYVVTGRDANG